MMDEAVRVVIFDELPSPKDFQLQIESRNVPAVLHGCIKNWKAFIRWSPSNGGLDYLQERVGFAVVEAMLSRSAPVFYGDLRGHEMVPIPFSEFVTSCKRLEYPVSGSDVCVELENHKMTDAVDGTCEASVDSHTQIYLAQVPIMNSENKERTHLDVLREDIETPAILESRTLSSINLWMNNAKSRSSTHYDPHHNLLCVVSGCKEVVLWPPSASPFLYPMPVYGEASNHSSVDLEKPDYSIHSRARHSLDYSQRVTLHAGDALFIPEGWFHQVNSDELTIAVNYWWPSGIMVSMSEHMDAYYLRRILKRLVDSEMNHMLDGASLCKGKSEKHVVKTPANEEVGYPECNPYNQNEPQNAKATTQEQKTVLHQLKPSSLQALHGLVSLVHDNVNVGSQSQPVPVTSIDSSTTGGECRKTVSGDSFCLEDDPVAYILWTLESLELQNVILAMAQDFPRTLETLILHVLSPVGAEVLTRKFEEIDKLTTKEEQSKFYEILYSVFDNQFAAMDSILNAKETFAMQAFRNVLDKYVGANFDGPK